MNFSQGHSGTKVQCESCLFPKEKHQNSHKKMGEIHEFFVLAVSFGLPGRLLHVALITSAELGGGLLLFSNSVGNEFLQSEV